MLLEQSEQQNNDDVFNEKRAVPSKRIISALGTATGGFLFSTTPIIIRILKSICSNMDDSATSFIASGWLYGSIVGILLFGYIGDTLGYYKGMILSSFLTFLGLFSGSLSLFLSPTSVPYVYGLCRIIMGIGNGGSIPIAYTRTASQKDTPSSMSQTSSVLLLLQSSSWLLGPVLFNIFIRLYGNTEYSLRIVLQCILFVASIPSFISLILLLYSYNQIIYTPLDTEEIQSVNTDETTVSVPTDSTTEKQSISICRGLLMTAVTWFLYDFNSYGNTFFSRSIIESIIAVPNTPLGSTIPLIIAGLFGVPGQFIIHAIFKKYTVKRVQIIGFGILSILFLIASIGFYNAPKERSLYHYIFFIIYHLTFFFSTCGPGSTTYILPSLVFPQSELSFYHGICTCMGKLGGAIGATLFPVLIKRIGGCGTLIVSSIVSLVGSLLTSL